MHYAFFTRRIRTTIAVLSIAGLLLANPGLLFALPSVVFEHTFEGVQDQGIPEGWTETGQGTWGAFNLGGDPGVVMYGDIENYDPYANNISTELVSPTINLEGRTTGSVTFTTRCDTEYTDPATGDAMTLRISGDNGASFTEVLRWNEFSIDTNNDASDIAEKAMTASIPAAMMTNAFKLAFGWHTNTADGATDGCYIDNLQIQAEGEGTGGGSPDTTAPTVTITTPAEGTSATAGTVVSIDATTNEAVTSCSATDGTQTTTLTAQSATHYTGTLTLGTAGSYTLSVSCTDAAGNTGTDTVGVTATQDNGGGGDTGGGDTGGGDTGGDTGGGSTLFFENFESLSDGIPQGWTQGGSNTWGAYALGNEDGVVLYGDVNYPYLENVNSTIFLPTIDASSVDEASVSVETRCDTKYAPPGDGSDYMILLSSPNGTDFTELARWNEFSLDSDTTEGDFTSGTITAPIPASHLTANLKLIFMWITSGSGGSLDGCYINDVTVSTEDAGGNTGGGGDTGGGDTGGGTDTPIQVTACTTLSESNRTYVLQSDLSTSIHCLLITGDNITLDGNGKIITGSGFENTYGVHVSGDNVTVKNIRVQGFYGGVAGLQANDGSIENVTVSHNNYGILWKTSSGVTIDDVTAADNENGIYLEGTTGSSISNSTASNGDVGIYLVGSNGNTITNNTVSSNDRGILLVQSSNNTLTSNTANNNTFGLAFEVASFNNTANGFTGSGNDTGIAIGSENNSIINATLQGTTNRGIRLFDNDVSNTLIKNVTVSLSTGGATDLVLEAGAMEGITIDSSAIQSYSITSNAFLTVKNAHGTVTFPDAVSGTGSNFSEDIALSYLRVTLGGAFNQTATVKLSNVPLGQTNYEILRNGVVCETCTVSGTLGAATTATFTTSTGGTFEIVWDGKGEDTVAPTVELENLSSGPYEVNGSINLSVRLSEGGRCDYSIGNNTTTRTALTASENDTLFGTSLSFATAGLHNVNIHCNDYAGNLANQLTIGLEVEPGTTPDTTAPTVTITTPAEGTSATAGTVVSIDATTNEAVTSCSATDGTQTTTLTAQSATHYTGTLTLGTAGSYTLSVSCTDAAGNTGTDTVGVTATQDNGGGGDTGGGDTGGGDTGGDTGGNNNGGNNTGTTTPPFISNVRITLGTGETVGTTTLGQGYIIRWDSNASLFDIFLVNTSGSLVQTIATSTEANFNNVIPSLSWVPLNITNGTYMIKVAGVGTTTVAATSSPFAVTSSTPTATTTSAIGNFTFARPTLTATTTIRTLSYTTNVFPFLASGSTDTHLFLGEGASGLPLRLGTVTITGIGGEGTVFHNLSLQASTTAGVVGLYFQGNSNYTASGTPWNGLIFAPQVVNTDGINLSLSDTLRARITKAIAIGSTNVKFLFSKAVRIFIEGAGNQNVGYVENGRIIPITAVCAADTEAAGNSLGSGADCRMQNSSDLIIWTKHLTTFVTYNTETVSSNNSGNNNNTGGGGGGGGGGIPPGNGPIIVTTLSPLGNPTVTGTSILGDFTRDGIIDGRDIDAFIALIGTSREGEADLNGGGVVDIRDFNRLMTLVQI